MEALCENNVKPAIRGTKVLARWRQSKHGAPTLASEGQLQALLAVSRISKELSRCLHQVEVEQLTLQNSATLNHQLEHLAFR